MHLANIRRLGVKELWSLWRDPIMLVLIVYAFTLAIYMAGTAVPDTVSRAALAIVDEDDSPLSTRIAAAFYPPHFLRPVMIGLDEVARIHGEMRALWHRLMRQAIPDITAAAPLILTSSDARLKGHALSTTILGSNADLPGVLDLQLAQGRFLSQFDTHSTHAVLGANVAAAWENAGIHAQPGDRIQIGGYLFQVIGILQPAGQNPLLPAPPDDAILLPLEGMRRIIPSPQITSVLARNPNGATLVQTSPALQQWVEGRMPGYEVNVQIPRLLLEGMAKQSRLFSWLLAGLGSIALLAL